MADAAADAADAAAASGASSPDSGEEEAFLGGLPTPRRFVGGEGEAPPLSTAVSAVAAAAAAVAAVAAAALALTDRRLPGEAGSCCDGDEDGDEVDAVACDPLRGCFENGERERGGERRKRSR